MKYKKIDTKNCLLPLLMMFVFITSGITGCSDKKVSASNTAPPPPEVTVIKPVKQSVTSFAEFTGTTEAMESVSIRARVEGFLEKIHFTPGDRVNEGDLLFTIDDEQYQALLDEAEADLSIRKAELIVAEARFLRRERAFKDKAVSEVAVIEAQSALATSKASVGAAEASVKTAKLNLSYTRVKAPVSGRIGRSLVDTGNLVGAGERTLLTTIVNDESIYVYFSINERALLHYLKLDSAQPSPAGEGTPVSLGLTNQDGYPYTGRIDYIHNRMETSTGTISVRGIFSNPDYRLIPGLFARLRIPVGNAAEALLVPDMAVVYDQQGPFLLKINAENVVQYQPVSVGIMVNDMRVISNGITNEDRIIINGLHRAHPGAVVAPVETSPAAADTNKSESSSV